MDGQYRILIVEDEEIISNQIKEYLSTWGYQVRSIQDFSAILQEFTQYRPHLVLLDISLPFYNGFYWCQEIRKISKVPILFLSSAHESMNIVLAMNMGGDDFVAKPFDLQVLSAKIQALLRRSYDFQENRQVIIHGSLTLDLGSMLLTYQSHKIELSKNEFIIMRLLMENKGRTVAREEMMQALWEDECFVDDNTLTVNMTRLRKKLHEEGISEYIKTKKGVGYLVEE